MVNINGARQRVSEMYPRRGLTEIYDHLKMYAFATVDVTLPFAFSPRMNSREIY